MEVLRVKTARRTRLVDMTEEVERAVAAAGLESGVCYVYVPHTTAGVTIKALRSGCGDGLGGRV